MQEKLENYNLDGKDCFLLQSLGAQNYQAGKWGKNAVSYKTKSF